MTRTIRTLCLGSILAASLVAAGCGESGGTVQPPKPDPTPAATGPVSEPPSTDEK